MQTPKLTCPNKIFPEFSVSLNLAYKEQVGRHVVASRDIRSGEILAVEDPAISFLNLDERGAVKFGSCCTHCFIRNLDCLPSPLTNCVSYIRKQILNYLLLKMLYFFYLYKMIPNIFLLQMLIGCILLRNMFGRGNELISQS